MKIALCYTGHLRTWNLCNHNHIDNIIKPNGDDCTSFFYTYENPNYALFNEVNQRMKWTQCPHPFYDDPFGEHKFNTRKRPESQAHQVLNQWHNMLVGFSLIPKGYDFYVRIRPDMKFNGPLKFSDYEPKPNTIYIPKGMDYHGINDQFAFGDYDTMRKYFSVYLNAHELFEEGHEFNSEIFHLANLNKLGVNIVRIEHPQHDLIR